MISTRRRLLMSVARAGGKRQLGQMAVGDTFYLDVTVAGQVYKTVFVVAHKGSPSDATGMFGGNVYSGFDGGVIVLKATADKWTQSAVAMSGWEGSAMKTTLLDVYEQALDADVWAQIMQVGIPCRPTGALNAQTAANNQTVWVPSAAEYGATDAGDGEAFDLFSGADAAANRAETNGNSHMTRSVWRTSTVSREYFYYKYIAQNNNVEQVSGVNRSAPTIYARVCFVLPQDYLVEVVDA